MFTGIIILVVLMIGIISKQYNNLFNDKDAKIFQANTNNLSVWVAYWDLNSDSEIKSLNSEIKTLDVELKNICYFAVNFNSNNELVIPKKLIKYYKETKSPEYNKYITIVNDKINSDGSSQLKDTNLLKSLLCNSDLRSGHIEEIINLAVKYDFDGIEIDYEQIKNDMKLWDDYILFINELNQKAEKQGLKIRVVLEPNTPFDKLSFKDGPTYVIMCYNFHGAFSEPGEKANPNFIRDLIEKTSKIPGTKGFAIATGGFNWASNDKTTQVSEIEASLLLKKYNVKAKRDDESQCLVFKYIDEKNIEHQVWYADKITLESWMKVIVEEGYGISIWRLGGNLF